MGNLNGFDANDHVPLGVREVVPAGKYRAAITESVMKPTKDGRGKYLELTFQILDGEYKGHMLWARLNLQNPSETAVAIAKSALSAICHAVGVMRPIDSSELHHIPMFITVSTKNREDTGEPTNEIKGYGETDNVAARTAQPAVAGAAKPQHTKATTQGRANAQDTPPWER